MANQHASTTPQASLLGLPYELREHIFSYTFQRQDGPIVIKGREISFQHHSEKSRRQVGERPRAYLLPQGDTGDYSLYSTQPLGQANRQLRHEISSFLRTAPVDIVTQVFGFDYTHLIIFLKSLPPAKLISFTVQPDIDADLTRSIRIELAPDFKSKWLPNLNAWLSTITSLIGPNDELSIATSLARFRPSRLFVYKLYRYWRSLGNGPAREEMRKILIVLWVRLRLGGCMLSGVFYMDPLGAKGIVQTGKVGEEEEFLRWIWLGF